MAINQDMQRLISSLHEECRLWNEEWVRVNAEWMRADAEQARALETLCRIAHTVEGIQKALDALEAEEHGE